MAGDAQHDLIVAPEAPGARQRERRRRRDPARGLAEHAGVLSEPADPVDQLGVAHGARPTPRVADRASREPAVCRVPDRQRAADGARHDRLDPVAAPLDPITFPASSSSGMKIHALSPARAACAATAFARFPVEAHPTVSIPKAAAALSAAATTLSLKEREGWQTVSFFTQTRPTPRRW